MNFFSRTPALAPTLPLALPPARLAPCGVTHIAPPGMPGQRGTLVDFSLVRGDEVLLWRRRFLPGGDPENASAALAPGMLEVVPVATEEQIRDRAAWLMGGESCAAAAGSMKSGLHVVFLAWQPPDLDRSWMRRLAALGARAAWFRSFRAKVSTYGGGYFLAGIENRPELLQKALRLARVQVAVAREQGDPLQELQGRVHEVYGLLHLGRRDKAERRLRSCRTLAKRHGQAARGMLEAVEWWAAAIGGSRDGGLEHHRFQVVAS